MCQKWFNCKFIGSKLPRKPIEFDCTNCAWGDTIGNPGPQQVLQINRSFRTNQKPRPSHHGRTCFRNTNKIDKIRRPESPWLQNCNRIADPLTNILRHILKHLVDDWSWQWWLIGYCTYFPRRAVIARWTSQRNTDVRFLTYLWSCGPFWKSKYIVPKRWLAWCIISARFCKAISRFIAWNFLTFQNNFHSYG